MSFWTALELVAVLLVCLLCGSGIRPRWQRYTRPGDFR
jgi:hypothetical protein